MGGALMPNYTDAELEAMDRAANRHMEAADYQRRHGRFESGVTTPADSTQQPAAPPPASEATTPPE